MRLLLILFTITFTKAFAISDTLYINKYDTLINGAQTSLCSFNNSDTFSTVNQSFQININDSLEITVINNDTLDQDFTIDGTLVGSNTILAGGTATFVIKFNELGTYRYYSDRSYGKLLGASGIIHVTSLPDIHYYWNLYDIQSNASHDIAKNFAGSFPIDYTPNLFTINGYFFPNTTTDTTGFVQENVGDTINISIINSGNIDHVLHFHGYHIKILDAKINQQQINWIKDTFPVKKGEAMTVQLVPHQAGQFPVHDHNLINVTNAGAYPGGMITMLNIQ